MATPAAPAPSGFASGPGLPAAPAPAPGPNGNPTASPGQAQIPGAPPAEAPGAEGGHGGMPKDPKKVPPFPFYKPSFTMAISASVLYFCSFVSHMFQMIKYKTWYLNLVPQAALMSTVSMIARTHSIVTAKETGMTGPFMVYMIISAIAPSLVIFGNIFTFTRIMWWVTPNDKRNTATLWGPPRAMSLTWGFAVMIPDIAKMVGQKAFKPEDVTGLRMQTIAQMIQVFVVTGFFIMTLRFMTISKKWLIHGECEEKRWRTLGWTTVTISGLLAFRHLFAQIAFDGRADSKAFYTTHEWMYWATQEIPVFMCYTLWNIHYPGAFLPFEYCRFKFDVKKIEKAKMESSWPLQISNPIRTDEEYATRHDDFIRPDDKGIEITLSDLETGRKYNQK